MVKGGVRYSAAGFHSLLVPIDLSPASDRVVGRVAQLPLAEGCRITLLHVISMDLPVRDRKRAEVAARKVLRAEAQELGRQLPRGVALQSVVAQGAAATEIARYATSVKAELVVMGPEVPVQVVAPDSKPGLPRMLPPVGGGVVGGVVVPPHVGSPVWAGTLTASQAVFTALNWAQVLSRFLAAVRVQVRYLR